jgi:hypothetical protein
MHQVNKDSFHKQRGALVQALFLDWGGILQQSHPLSVKGVFVDFVQMLFQFCSYALVAAYHMPFRHVKPHALVIAPSVNTSTQMVSKNNRVWWTIHILTGRIHRAFVARIRGSTPRVRIIEWYHTSLYPSKLIFS